jgi:hypothetical protein
MDTVSIYDGMSFALPRPQTEAKVRGPPDGARVCSSSATGAGATCEEEGVFSIVSR